jgi:hypothetical protein
MKKQIDEKGAISIKLIAVVMVAIFVLAILFVVAMAIGTKGYDGDTEEPGDDPVVAYVYLLGTVKVDNGGLGDSIIISISAFDSRTLTALPAGQMADWDFDWASIWNDKTVNLKLVWSIANPNMEGGSLSMNQEVSWTVHANSIETFSADSPTYFSLKTHGSYNISLVVYDKGTDGVYRAVTNTAKTITV